MDTLQRITPNRLPGAGTPRFSQPAANRPPRAAAAPPVSLRTVLVPLDGSREAEQALPVALQLARSSGAILELALCYSLHRSGPFSSGFWLDEHGSVDQRHRNYLQQLTSSEHLGGVLLRPTLVETSNVAGALCALAQACDLVVLAARRCSAWRSPWRRSVDRDLLQAQRRPVLLLPATDGPPDYAAAALPRHVLAPLSGNPASEVALGPAAILSQVCSGRTTLLHVEDVEDGRDHFSHSSPRGYLNWARREFQQTHPDVGADVVSLQRSLPQTILDYAQTHQADLIALARPMSGRRSAGLCEKLLAASRLPLLVTRS